MASRRLGALAPGQTCLQPDAPFFSPDGKYIDVLAVGGEERVVRLQERLAGREVTRPRELPSDPALRVDDQQPVVPVVGDEDVGGQHRRVRTRREPTGTGGRRETWCRGGAPYRA